jgi:hypothetical protein
MSRRKAYQTALLNLRLPEPILAQLQKLADLQYKSTSQLVRDLIVEHIQTHQTILVAQVQPQQTQAPKRKWTRAEIEEAKQLKYEASQIQWGDDDIPKPPSQQQVHDEWD